MCFNKSSSSSPTSTSTITRDERIGLEGGGSAMVLKDISMGRDAAMNVTVMDTSPAALAEGFAYAGDIAANMAMLAGSAIEGAGAAFYETIELADRTAQRGQQTYSDALGFVDEQNERAWGGITGVIDDVLNFSAGRSGEALQFARETQAAYQEAAASAATQDATEMAQMMVKYTTLAVVAFFAFQIFGKGL